VLLAAKILVEERLRIRIKGRLYRNCTCCKPCILPGVIPEAKEDECPNIPWD